MGESGECLVEVIFTKWNLRFFKQNMSRNALYKTFRLSWDKKGLAQIPYYLYFVFSPIFTYFIWFFRYIYNSFTFWFIIPVFCNFAWLSISKAFTKFRNKQNSLSMISKACWISVTTFIFSSCVNVFFTNLQSVIIVSIKSILHLKSPSSLAFMESPLI